MVKYHNNGALVQELVSGKLISGQWKEHPEFPGKEEPKLNLRYRFLFLTYILM